MDLEFSEEQTLLADAVNGYLTGAYDLEARRRAVASEAGWRPEVWKALAEDLGVLLPAPVRRITSEDGRGGTAPTPP